MTKTVTSNYTSIAAPGNTFNQRISADSDTFARNDIDALGNALELHDHSNGKGLNVGTIANPTFTGTTTTGGMTIAGAINQTSGGSAFTGNMSIASGTLMVSAGTTTLTGTTNDSSAFSLIARNLAATTVLSARNDGTVNVCSSAGNLGFFGTGSPAVKATVTGSKGANAALTSLMTALAGYGLVTDSTT